MKKITMTLPKVVKSLQKNRIIDNFPLDHYSYSTFVKFSTNPIMFKIQYINGDRIETTTSISGVIGKAFHSAMETYYSALKAGKNESEAIKLGLEEGIIFVDQYKEGFIKYSKTVANKQKATEKFVFAFNSYVKENKLKEGVEIVSCEECIETSVDVKWKDRELKLPVPLKGYLDKIQREDGKLKIYDYKATSKFSDPDKIDGAKILQAVEYYFLVYAEYEEKPYSITFEEVKTSKNRDGGKQIKEYEVVYADNELFFDFYFRFYEDITKAINGEAVFVPNIYTFFDNEVSIIAYIHRLDESEKVGALMKEMKVKNITDLLKKKIASANSMKTFLKTVDRSFVSAKSINYNNMKNEEKIKTKLMEHGVLLEFEDKVEGFAVDLYRFAPTIGLKMNKLKSYVADVEQIIGVAGVRVLAPIPNSSFVGFEVPRKDRRFLEEEAVASGFELAIGADVYGEIYKFDIRKAPHILVAGATGSGKSVFLNSIISQLLKLDKVDLHLFDPKIVELARFKDEAWEYASDMEEIYVRLDDLVDEMNSRYAKLAEAGARNIEEFNGEMRYKFIVIDEFGDIVLGDSKASKEISKNVLILAQKARACGIHLIIATQRPSVDIITGVIKANFPVKVAFRMAKAIDSQVLLDEAGAEKLQGMGDMIFSSDSGQVRLQGFNN